jgi:hypothetical protein
MSMSIGGHEDVADRDDPLVDAVLCASCALMSVTARSLATSDGDVTWAQNRFLVELADRGPWRLAELAEARGVERSTATRMADRPPHKWLVSNIVQRMEQTDSRAAVAALRAFAEATGEVPETSWALRPEPVQ